jgi:hypothetical protein
MKINLLYVFVVSRIVLSVWDEAVGTGIRTVLFVASMWLCCGVQDYLSRLGVNATVMPGEVTPNLLMFSSDQ